MRAQFQAMPYKRSHEHQLYLQYSHADMEDLHLNIFHQTLVEDKRKRNWWHLYLLLILFYYFFFHTECFSFHFIASYFRRVLDVQM